MLKKYWVSEIWLCFIYPCFVKKNQYKTAASPPKTGEMSVRIIFFTKHCVYKTLIK
jgi:hypothetical protein